MTKGFSWVAAGSGWQSSIVENFTTSDFFTFWEECFQNLNFLNKNLFFRQCSNTFIDEIEHISLREKCPYSEFFWFVLFRIRTEYGEYLTVFSPNAGKHGPEKLRIRTLFTQFMYKLAMEDLPVLLLFAYFEKVFAHSEPNIHLSRHYVSATLL